MSDQAETPVWKLAAADAAHPLHQATWLLFSEAFNVTYAAQKLAAQKAAVIDYCCTILECLELGQTSSFGSGFAPANAARLLGHWQVTAAIPLLIALLEDTADADDWGNVVDEAAQEALKQMGSAAVEPMLALANEYADSKMMLISVADVLSGTGKGDPRALAFLKRYFEQAQDDLDIDAAALYLLECSNEEGIAFIEAQMRTRRYSKHARETLTEYLKDAREGKL